MGDFFTSMPGRAIWTLFAIILNAVRFPIWIITFIPAAGRQHPKWSFRQAMGVQIVKNFLWNAARVDMKTPLSIKPGFERKQWVVAPVPASKYFTGVTNADPEIVPVPTGATWYPQPPNAAKKSGLVILHFHGGAYMIGDGRNQDAGFAGKILVANTDATHVYAPQYRLAGNPRSRFPAALQDAITSYVYLIEKEGISPDRIVFSGDSAGANLALALLRYIGEHGAATGLQGPISALLWSPWVSPSRSETTEAFDLSPNRLTDYVTGEFGVWGAHAYRPSKASGLDLHSPYISFVNQAFATETPIYISAGECEVLFPDIAELAQQMTAVKGNNVTFQIEEFAVHDIILAGWILGFRKEAARAAKRAGVYIRNITSKTA